MTIQDGQTVAELAALSPAAIRVFEDHGIDFCCGGSKPLAEACREKQVDPAVLVAELQAVLRAAPPPAVENWRTAPLEALIDHILAHHHAYLRAEFPRLRSRMAAVRAAHGERDGATLEELDRVLADLQQELEMHMHKEEFILFPAIRRGEPWIRQPIEVMEMEHECAGEALGSLRRLTSGHQPPEHACATHRALYAGLEELERDLHVHIHLENNILFPRAMQGAR